MPFRAAVVVQWVKPQPAVRTSYVGATSSAGCSTSDEFPDTVPGKALGNSLGCCMD